MNHRNNIQRISTVFNALSELQSRVVFVGGATISLYPDGQSYEVRETDDVDVIIELLNYSEHARFEEQLRAKGFANDIQSKVRCRYKIQGITVDIMPTSNIAMGFENRWYPEGFKKAVNYEIDEKTIVKILSAPYFIATKLEAFKNRGAKDGRTSQDFEDIIYVFENRRKIWREMRDTDQSLKDYLITEFSGLIANLYIYEWIDCHVEDVSPPSTDWILNEIQKFIDSK